MLEKQTASLPQRPLHQNNNNILNIRVCLTLISITLGRIRFRLFRLVLSSSQWLARPIQPKIHPWQTMQMPPLTQIALYLAVCVCVCVCHFICYANEKCSVHEISFQAVFSLFSFLLLLLFFNAITFFDGPR